MEPEQSRVKTPLFERLLSTIERKPASDRLALRFLFFAVIASGLYLALSLNASYISETPTAGGTLIEGVVGTPRFVNPILAITRADQDLTALVYSGLMQLSPEGTLVPDVAESVTLSEDGTTYTIKVREDVRFHDGTPLTARDVTFTLGLIQNADLKSPLRGNWNDVTVEEVSEYELVVTLPEPYAPFSENFTFGILPRHIWSDLPIEQLPFSQRNSEPIGSGPFKIEEVNRNKAGLINAYTLRRFEDAAQPPKLETVIVRFYQNEADVERALLAGEITSTASFANERLAAIDEDAFEIIATPLPRSFGIFFNQNRSTVLRDAGAREALDVAIDRTSIISEVLAGYGIPTTGPVPAGFLGVESEPASSSPDAAASLDAARQILTDHGWERGEDGTWQKEINEVPYILAVTLRTANAPLFEATATRVAERWRELGALVNVEQYEQADLLQAVIRPRDFEALLFGTDLSRAVDLYPFWHSSQKDDPGLNIAQYTNLDVDDLLEEVRSTQTAAAAEETVREVASIIAAERPAIFLYTPVLTYVMSAQITTTPMVAVSRPHERFMNIESWHADTGALWPIFDSN